MLLDDAEVEAILAKLPPAGTLYSDEPAMETSQHYRQLALLVACLERLWEGRDDYFIGANLTVYFDLDEMRNRNFRGPDLFVVRGGDRKSWVLWEESGRYPDLIIELLSESTERNDRGPKKGLYQDTFRTPEYFWFSPQTLEFLGFKLAGTVYTEIAPDAEGRRWSGVLGLFLGVQDGKLRYFDREGILIPTPEEAEKQERQRAEQAEHRAEQAEHRAERLARHLREQGIDPDLL
jgi:Uma2 family endonuclease